jgi:ATP-dependent exoDNAse (exonuclease V) beta subunit
VELLDFKTDRVEPGAEDALVEQYRPQIDAYRAALSIMLNRPASAIAASLLLLATGTRRTV